MPKKKDINGVDAFEDIEPTEPVPAAEDLPVVDVSGQDLDYQHPEDANVYNDAVLPSEEVLHDGNVKPWTTGDEDPKDPQLETVPLERVHPEDCSPSAPDGPPVTLKGHG